MRGPDPGSADSLADPEALAAGQLAPWFGCRLAGPEGDAAFAALNAKSAAVFILDIAHGEARLHEKPEHYPAAEIAGTAPPSANLLDRAHLYRVFLRDLVRARGYTTPLRLAFTTEDTKRTDVALPLFAYQKLRGSALVLWPDIEFLRYGFYAAPEFSDPFDFAEKADRAIFVGATTGARLTPAVVAALGTPRLGAAVHFKGSPRIRFLLPHIVQCSTPEARAAIAALGVGGARHSWQEMYACRYLIAIDGNGISCSRVALGLRSQGVLVKYESPWQLFYFDRMLPWRHYIPVVRHDDVSKVMDFCAENPDFAAGIAEAGSAFARHWLDRPAIEDHAFALLRRYAASCGFSGA